MVMTALAAASRWARGAAELATKPGGRDEDRLASGLFLLVTGSGAAAGALWALAYVLLGRPLSAAVPGAFAVAATAVGIMLLRRRKLGRLRELMLLLILLLPAVLQASLGGYVKGSAVVMWSFFAPLSALVFFGPRAGWAWLAGFVAVTGVLAVLDGRVAQSVRPLPETAQTALFAFNLCGVAALVTLVLAYFRIQRDQATERSERLLLNVLPPEIAERLKRKEYPIADRFDDVSVLFADMVGFTERSAGESPEVTVGVLNEFLTAFDELAQQHGLRPIRTTGDSYLVVGGLPVAKPDHAEAVANMALDMLDKVDSLNRLRGWAVSFRIGINSGPAMAAVVGRHRFTYDVWSDAVNTASRMESSGVPGRIQVTEETYRRLIATFEFECRGEIDVKGKGVMRTYFLIGRLLNDPEPEEEASQGTSRAHIVSR
ncbi:MAG: adenylate/guanylate cyclase domain-containing protein [Chloroflexi bacterium]|nr:MAG: adenylate/guanylate cyclase domain-containing protein [Chloroflexota bacterium]